MFYPSYDDYMRDVFYFNGLSNPNRNYGFNPENSVQDVAMPNMNNMYCMNNNSNNVNILNNLYPSIYKIVWPVIQKVISGNNYQFITEEIVNNTVDVVFGIIQGDMNHQENDSRRANSNNASSNYNSNENNALMKDLIKILVIRELISKNNIRRFPYNGVMPYYNYMPPYMVN